MKATCIVLGLIFCTASAVNGQTTDHFSKVNTAQRLRLENKYSEERDSIIAYFNTTISELLNSKDACSQLPDTSNHYFLVNQLKQETEGITIAYGLINNVVITTEGDLKVYSWDDLEGGSFHSYINYLQYVDAQGTCNTYPMDTGQDDPEVGYYDIRQVGNYY
ncbi:MAG: hypothetical protein AAFQ98_26955 [Bacteroidota bacterium]